MKKYLISLLTLAMVFSLPIATQAGFFYTEYTMGSPTWHSFVSADTWVYFGGCENSNKQACMTNLDSAPYLNIGDYNVKQGVYGLSVPNDQHVHGKLVLNYTYRFLSEEDGDNTSDVGYIKLKDVETNKVYYLKTLVAKNSSEDWITVRRVLPNRLVNKKLQLVFEVQNDAARLSTLSVDKINITHLSQPVIRGTVYVTEAGKNVAIDDVNVKLQNADRTKTYYKTTTKVQTDTPDSYSFWPVPVKKDLVVVATYNGEEKVMKIGKMKYGTFEPDIDFTFEN